jgi:hypothetical protein
VKARAFFPFHTATVKAKFAGLGFLAIHWNNDVM